MILGAFVLAFDDEDYSQSFIETLKNLKVWVNENNILYLIKNLVIRNNFTVDRNIKLLLFYYFYLQWEVVFENWYSLKILNQKLDVRLTSLLMVDKMRLTDLKQYFDFWKNDIFLNKIVDLTISKIPCNADRKIVWADNIVDFCMLFIKECSGLYAFSWEHFPLLKWLINEII